MSPASHAARFAVGLLSACLAAVVIAQDARPLPGNRTLTSKAPFDTALERLEQSIEANGMGLVAMASASRGAAARSVRIPGNAVVMVFRNDYAVRMLEASVPAGVEAPLRIYVTENANGTTNITWRAPSAVFAPYQNAGLDALARELDPIFEKIVRDAVR